MKHICPLGHESAWKICVRCEDMIAAARVETTQRIKAANDMRGKVRGPRPVRSGPDETGNRYGRLTVIRRHSPPGNPRGVEWLCVCDCGREKIAQGSNLRRGQCKSCGCLAIEVRRDNSVIARKSAKRIVLTEADKARCKRISDKMNAKAIAMARRVA